MTPATPISIAIILCAFSMVSVLAELTKADSGFQDFIMKIAIAVNAMAIAIYR